MPFGVYSRRVTVSSKLGARGRAVSGLRARTWHAPGPGFHPSTAWWCVSVIPVLKWR